MIWPNFLHRTGIKLEFIACSFLLFASTATAQNTGAILGIVTDPSGAIVAGAKVTIINTSTSVERTIQTNTAGHYVAEALPVGTYDISVEKTGFKPYNVKNVVVNVADRVSVDAKLVVGSASESVEVHSDATRVQTETGEISYLVAGDQITELGLNGRNFTSLVALNPGVATDTDLADEPKQGWEWKGIYVNGLFTQYNNWSIDGGFNVDPGSGGAILPVYPVPEAIGEFKMMSSNYSAEYGASGSMDTLVVLRSGTNKFHGSAYEFIRNDLFDARNWFDTVKPPLRVNDFGYTFGGPVAIPGISGKNHRAKTFFFWSENWRRRRQGVTVFANTIPDAFRAGDFTALGPNAISNPADPTTGNPEMDPVTRQPCVQNDIISQNCINTFGKSGIAYLNQLWPSPNYTPTSQHPFNYSALVGDPYNFRQELVRVDHDFSDHVKLMVHYIHDSVFEHYPNTLWWGGNLPTITSTANTPGDNLMVKLTTIINPTLVNEVSYNLSRTEGTVLPVGAFQKSGNLQVNELYSQNNALNRIPDLWLLAGGYGVGGSGFQGLAQFPWNHHVSTHSFADTLSKASGKHEFEMGVLYQYHHKNQDAGAQTNGVFYTWGQATGDPIADLLTNNGDFYFETAYDPRGFFRYHQFEAFFQDDWKVTPRLTVNLGLRYYYIPHLFASRIGNINCGDPNLDLIPGTPLTSAQCNNLSSFNPSLYNAANPLVAVVSAGQNGIPRGIVDSHPYRDWGPRIGFAYDLTGRGKTVLRGGFGMGYARVQGNDTFGILGNPPFNTSNNVYLPPFDNPGNVPAGSGDILGPNTPSMLALDPVYKTPTVYTYSLGVQQELVRNTVLSVAYVGSRAAQLERSIDINQPLPVPGFQFDPALSTGGDKQADRPYQGFSSISWNETTARSWYDSLQINLQRRSTRGLTLGAAYTYSKNLSTVPGGSLASPQDAYHPDLDKGLTPWDWRHNATINYVYELPFLKSSSAPVKAVLANWELSGIIGWHTGATFTPNLGGSNGNQMATRPAVVADPNSGPKTAEQWFNINAFVLPADGFFGNARVGSIRGPGYQNWNMALMKNFPYGERLKVQFRAEAFNVFNHANFRDLDTNLANITSGTYGQLSASSGAFGHVTSAHDPRILEFGLKVQF